MTAFSFDAATCELHISHPPGTHDGLRERVEYLPPVMRNARRWLLWRTGKIPCYVSGVQRHGRLDSAEDVAQLATLPDALAALAALDRDSRFEGLGFALGFDPALGLHWQGLDLDGALDAAGQFTTERARTLYEATDGYAEVSPSGAGLHVIGLGAQPFAAIKWKRPGEQAVEFYSGARFFTLTGRMMREGEPADLAPLAERVRAELVAAGKTRERRAREHVSGSAAYLDRMPEELRAWVQAHPIEAALAEHGYQRTGDRWLSPRSDSGVPGVVVLDELRAVSFHTSDAGIGTGVQGDGEVFNAFDCEVRYRFGGDRTRALREMLPRARQEPEDEQPSPIEYARLDNLDSDPPPPRRWVLPEWLPRGSVTALFGGGGIGKSLLVQQVATCVANGLECFGKQAVMGPALVFLCEDDDDEVRRRQRAILARLGRSATYSAEGLHIQARAGLDNVMMTFGSDRVAQPGPFMQAVERECERIRPALLVLDNIAQLFGGLENDRHEVTVYANHLTGLARRLDCAVLLLGHVAKAQGSEFSGSTAWEAAVRTRLWMERREDGLIELHKRKANYSKQESVLLEYQDGALVEIDESRRNDTATTRAGEDALFAALATFTAREVVTSHVPTARNNLVRLGLKERLLAMPAPFAQRALNELIDSGRLVVNAELPWRKADRHRAIGLALAPGGEAAPEGGEQQDETAPESEAGNV